MLYFSRRDRTADRSSSMTLEALIARGAGSIEGRVVDVDASVDASVEGSSETREGSARIFAAFVSAMTASSDFFFAIELGPVTTLRSFRRTAMRSARTRASRSSRSVAAAFADSSFDASPPLSVAATVVAARRCFVGPGRNRDGTAEGTVRAHTADMVRAVDACAQPRASSESVGLLVRHRHQRGRRVVARRETG